MGPSENPTHPLEKQATHGRRRPGCRPRVRVCLLKGCERRFHSEHARQRYCSQECREAARAWSGWKARQAYRATAAGKQKRNQQSQRYRKRVQERKPSGEEAVAEAARVITEKIIFSMAAATGLAATNVSGARGGRRCNGSAPMPASAPWNEFGNGSDAGEQDTAGIVVPESAGVRGSRERRQMSLSY